jgi:hypothetical protein
MRGAGLCQATIAAAIAIAGAAVPASVRADGDEAVDNEHYLMRAEAGMEFDSNAHRTEQIRNTQLPAETRSWLQRFVLTSQLSDVAAPGHLVAWSATAAGKLFDAVEARSENVAIAQSSLAWRATVAPGVSLTPAGVYYEAFQSSSATESERRDFRSLAPSLELRAPIGERFDISAGGGYRWLVFKANPDYDFDGPTGAVNLRWALPSEAAADWDAGLGAAMEHRRFNGRALVSPCNPPSSNGLPCFGGERRTDNLIMTRVDVTRTGAVLTGIGYAFHYNLSNSVGETVMRHFVSARFATALPWRLYVAARADLLFAFYSERVAIGMPTSPGSPYATIEDENRSSARVDLSRDIGERWRIFARYTFYANELGANSPLTYRRHTALLSAAFSLEK